MKTNFVAAEISGEHTGYPDICGFQISEHVGRHETHELQMSRYTSEQVTHLQQTVVALTDTVS